MTTCSVFCFFFRMCTFMKLGFKGSYRNFFETQQFELVLAEGWARV